MRCLYADTDCLRGLSRRCGRRDHGRVRGRALCCNCAYCISMMLYGIGRSVSGRVRIGRVTRVMADDEGVCNTRISINFFNSRFTSFPHSTTISPFPPQKKCPTPSASLSKRYVLIIPFSTSVLNHIIIYPTIRLSPALVSRQRVSHLPPRSSKL